MNKRWVKYCSRSTELCRSCMTVAELEVYCTDRVLLFVYLQYALLLVVVMIVEVAAAVLVVIYRTKASRRLIFKNYLNLFVLS